VVISIVTLLLFGPPLYAVIGHFLPSRRTASVEISFAQLLNDVAYPGRVRDIRIEGAEIYGSYSDGHAFQTDTPSDPTSMQQLYNKGVLITKRP
jgi:cell division protease FtsH